MNYNYLSDPNRMSQEMKDRWHDQLSKEVCEYIDTHKLPLELETIEEDNRLGSAQGVVVLTIVLFESQEGCDSTKGVNELVSHLQALYSNEGVYYSNESIEGTHYVQVITSLVYMGRDCDC